MKLKKSHKYKLPVRTMHVDYKLKVLYAKDKRKMHWRQDTWNAGHKIKHKSLSWWWFLARIPF